jgi:hypothetical protein
VEKDGSPLQNRIRAGLGCFTLVVIVLVFSIEATLAVLRQRNLDVTLEIRSAAQTPTPQATPDSAATPAPGATPEPKLVVLTLDPSATLIVHVKWDYRIGPRFPDTFVHAEVTGHLNQVVAFSENTVLCGTESLNCAGQFPLTLNNGVQGNQGVASNWPVGDYTLVVTSGIADLKPVEKLRQSFTVKDTP